MEVTCFKPCFMAEGNLWLRGDVLRLGFLHPGVKRLETAAAVPGFKGIGASIRANKE